MKKLLWFLVIVLLVAAGSYVAGYWSEHQRRNEAERSLAAARAQAQDLEAQTRLWILEDRLLMIQERILEKNYGLARDLSSPFFEEVRREATRTPREDYRAALDELHAQRDAVIAALTMGDPGVGNTLRATLERLRRALGRPRLSYTETPSAAPLAKAEATPSS